MKSKALLFFFILCAAFVNAQTDTLPLNTQYHYYLLDPTDEELRNYILKSELPSENRLKEAVYSSTDYPSKDSNKFKGTYFLFSVSDHSFYTYLWDTDDVGVIFHRHDDYVYMNLTDRKGNEIKNAEVSLYKKNKHISYDPTQKAYSFKCTKYNLPTIRVELDGESYFFNMRGTNSKLNKRQLKKKKETEAQYFEGYAMLSQAKYKPSDTLRFTAKVIQKGEDCKLPMQFRMIQSSPHYLQIDTTIEAQENGMYTIEMPVPDSFKLDQSILVVYSIKAKKDYLRGNLNFKIEEYELEETDFSANMIMEDDSLYVLVKAQDNNGFPKYGSKLNMKLSPSSISSLNSKAMYFDDYLFTLDTVVNEALLKLKVPDSITHLYKGALQADLTLTTPTNERHLTSTTHSVELKKLTINVNSDSTLQIKAYRSGESVSKDAKLYFSYGASSDHIAITTPFEADIDPNIAYTKLEVDGAVTTVFVSPKVNVNSNRFKDTAYFEMNNKRGLNIQFKLYEGKELIDEGVISDKHKVWKLVDDEAHSYYMNYWYTFNARVTQKIEYLHPMEKSLKVEIDQKTEIYPGEETKIELTLYDHKGKPVPNVAISSTSVSNQFRDNIDYDIKDLNPKYYTPYVYNNWTTHSYYKSTNNRLTKEWLKAFDLENNSVNALYVTGNQVKYTYFKLPEQALQNSAKHYGHFQPFVFDGSRWSNIVYVKLNNELVYDRSIRAPSDILVKEGVYNVTIRTQKCLIKIDSVEIKANHKLILSFDEKKLKETETVHKRSRSKKLKHNIKEDHSKHVAMVYNLSGENIIVESPGDETAYIGPGGYTSTKIGPYRSGDILYFKTTNRWHMVPYKEKTIYVVTHDNLVELDLNFITPYKDKLGKYGHEISLSTLSYTTTEMQHKKLFLYEDDMSVKSKNKVIFTGLSLQNVIIKDENSSRSYYVSSINSYSHQYLNKGIYRLYEVRNGKLRISDAFEVKDKKFNYFDLEFEESNETEIFDSLLQHFTYESRWQREAAGRSGLVITLKDFRDNALRAAHVEIQINKKDKKEAKWFYTDMKGRIILDLDKGDEIEIISFNKDCDRQGNGSLKLRYDLNQGLDHKDLILNCPTYSFSFKGKDDIMILRWSDNSYYNTTMSTDKLLRSTEGSWSSWFPRLRTTFGPTKYRKLSCPDFGGGNYYNSYSSYENVNYKNAYANSGTYGAFDLDYDGVSDYYDREDRVYVDGISIMGISNSARYRSKSLGRLIAKNESYGYADRTSYADMSDFNAFKGNTYQWNYGDGETETLYNVTGTYQTFITDSIRFTTAPIRKNFADLAYFNPFVITDANGKASYTVTYPEDLTKWRETFLAMDNEYRYGVFQTYVNSYLPISAQINTPRFLVEGDRSEIKTSLINKLEDSLNVTSKIMINGKEINTQTQMLDRSLFNTQDFVAPKVSGLEPGIIDFQFSMRAANGFKDGELRSVEVFPQGLQKASGHYFRIDGDTLISDLLKALPDAESYQYYYQQNTAEYVINRLESVINYSWDCNEQMASKLRAGLLLLQTPMDDKEHKALEKSVMKWLNELEENQLPSGGWGWWNRGRENIWMSCYVLEALHKAKMAGYEVRGIHRAQNFLKANCHHEYLNPLILNTLMNTGADHSYSDQIETMDEGIEKLLYQLRIKMLNKQSISSEEIKKLMSYSHRSLLGNLHWGRDSIFFGSKHVQYTSQAHQILVYAGENKLAADARAYLLEIGTMGRQPNTYESTWIGEAVFPYTDMTAGKDALFTLTVNGKKTEAKSGIIPKGDMQIEVKNSSVSYFTLYANSWDRSPEEKTDLFKLKTTMVKDNKDVTSLTAGEPVTLKVEVTALKQSSYVMLEIPIPAACSYDGSAYGYSRESHREKLKHMTRIYVEDMSAGTHTYYIQLLPRYSGSYHLNPAQAMQMYFPTLSGNNVMKTIEVK